MEGEGGLMIADAVAGLSRRLARDSAKLCVNGANWGRRVAALLYRYYPAKQGVTTIHDFDGDLTMCVDRGSYIGSAIYWGGHHSLPLVRFLRNFLTPEMTVVDVGANIGEITLFAAKKLQRGRVLAFEPNPRIFEQLSRNVALNQLSNVELFNAGLYDQQGVLPLYEEEEKYYGRPNEGMTSLFTSGRARAAATVPLRRLDDVAQECALETMDFLKIDVEGAEWMVLRGGGMAIGRFRPVIVAEVSAENFARAGYTPKDLLAFLESLDYEVRVLASRSADISEECDVLCWPRERKWPLEARSNEWRAKRRKKINAEFTEA